MWDHALFAGDGSACCEKSPRRNELLVLQSTRHHAVPGKSSPTLTIRDRPSADKLFDAQCASNPAHRTNIRRCKRIGSAAGGSFFLPKDCHAVTCNCKCLWHGCLWKFWRMFYGSLSDIIAMSGNHLRTIRLRSGVSWNMQLSGHPTLRELERLLARCFELFHGKDKVYPDAALPCVVPDTKETKLDLLLVQSRTAPASLQIFIAAEARKQDELPCTMPVFVLEELVLPCEPHPLDEVELGQLPAMLPRSCQGQLTVLKRFTELCCVDGEWERRRWRSLVFRTPGIRRLRRPFLIVFDEVIVRESILHDDLYVKVPVFSFWKLKHISDISGLRQKMMKLRADCEVTSWRRLDNWRSTPIRRPGPVSIRVAWRATLLCFVTHCASWTTGPPCRLRLLWKVLGTRGCVWNDRT